MPDVSTTPPTFFAGSIKAIEAAQQELEKQLKTLWQEFDPGTGTGGVYWHGAGSSVAQTVIQHLEDAKTLLASKDWRELTAEEIAALPVPGTAEPVPVATAVAPVAPVTGEVSGVAVPVAEPTVVTPPEVAATPAAVAHAEATGVDLTQVEGSGKEGTITKADVAAVATPEPKP